MSRPFRSLGKLTLLAKAAMFARKKRHTAADYEALLAEHVAACINVRCCDYVRLGDVGDRRYLVIRHDIDHDFQTALKIARWERARGLRATYCVLHTSWYYGWLAEGHMEHSQELVDLVGELSALGHEVNFHNNLVSTALREGIDPVAMLREELAFFRSLGVEMVGTTTHGDALCRELNYRNWELFTECCDDRFGGPRTVCYQHEGRTHRVELGTVPMAELGLEYEAYDFIRDTYLTDSGGHLRTRQDTRGRRPFGRPDPSRGHVVGVLTHPIWWNMD